MQTRPDQICTSWELEWLLHAYTGWQEHSHNKVLQIYFSHGPIPASVISDGVMWACLLVPACPFETLDEVLLWEKKDSVQELTCRCFPDIHGIWLSQSRVAPLTVCIRGEVQHAIRSSLSCPSFWIMFQTLSQRDSFLVQFSAAVCLFCCTNMLTIKDTEKPVDCTLHSARLMSYSEVIILPCRW